MTEQAYFLQFSGEDLPKANKVRVFFNDVEVSAEWTPFVLPPEQGQIIETPPQVQHSGLRDTTITVSFQLDGSAPNLFDDCLPTIDEGNAEVDGGE